MGKICFAWNGKVRGQISPIQGDVFLPFVPFTDDDPKEKKFVFAELQNEFDAEMINDLQKNGFKWVCFPLKECIRKKARVKE